MKTRPCLFNVLILLLLLSSFPLSADYLWNKAMSIYEQNQNWFAERMRITSEELDGDGKVQSREIIHVALSEKANGEIESEILSATKDGKDITEEKRRKPRGSFAEEREEEDSSSSALEMSPFDPEEQNNVTYDRKLDKKTIDGKRCVAYEFEHRVGKKEKNLGTVWIDLSSGAPILVEATQAPLPRFVSEMEVKLSYQYEEDNSWYLESLSFAGTGRFLFISKHFRTIMEFHQYKRKDR